MNKLLATVSALALGTMLSQPASAIEQNRWPLWYVGLNGGLTYLDETDIKGTSTGNLDFDTGGRAAIALGYSPSGISNLRLEAELGYQYSSLDSSVLGGVPASAPGSTQALLYMGNIYFDFRNQSGWTPYVGAGAGGARVELSKNSGLGNVNDDVDQVLAYQFMAGLAYAPETIPMTEWYVGYRYLTLHNPEFTTATGKIELDDLVSHNAEVGARFRF